MIGAGLLSMVLMAGFGDDNAGPARPALASPAGPDAEMASMALASEPTAALPLLSGILNGLAATRQHLESVTEPPAHSEPITAWITHYGERFNDRDVGCYAYGEYSSDDPTIVAVNPTLYEQLPCGTLLELCGPGGCLIAARKDSCPGCRPDGFDMSEAGFEAVCGDADGVCTASVRVLEVCQVRKFGVPRDEALRLEAEEAAQTGRIPCHPEPQSGDS